MTSIFVFSIDHIGAMSCWFFFDNILLLPLSFACPSFSERSACLALLYESLTQPSLRTGIKRVARVWRMSHSLHVKDNLWQHLTYTRLLVVVILGSIHAKKCSTLSINKCMLKKYVHVKTSFSQLFQYRKATIC